MREEKINKKTILINEYGENVHVDKMHMLYTISYIMFK